MGWVRVNKGVVRERMAIRPERDMVVVVVIGLACDWMG